MDTTAHIVCNLLIQSRPSQPRLFLFVVAGAIIPDLPIVLFYAWESWVIGSSEQEIWSSRYFLPGWQNFIDVFNSIPIIVILLALCAYLEYRLPTVVLIGMLLHILFDLPLHNDDAHRHFFPLSDWRFFSPLSYWDPDHYGDDLRVVQIGLVILGLIWLWIKNISRSVRAGVALLGVIYVGYRFFVYLVWMS